jgi:hypothetical protein
MSQQHSFWLVEEFTYVLNILRTGLDTNSFPPGKKSNVSKLIYLLWGEGVRQRKGMNTYQTGLEQ